MLSLKPSVNGKPVGITRSADVVYLDSSNHKLEKNCIDVEYLQPLPSTDSSREIVYIAAPSGSGKSIAARNYIKQYQAMYPDRDVFIFSKIRDDPSLKGIRDAQYIDINDDIVLNPINILEDCKNCLVLFDDIDTVSDKAQALALTQLMMDILECGRHANITAIITSHLILGLDKKRTRTILNESHRIIIFPKATTAQALKYFLKTYIGCQDKRTIAAICDVPSRYVSIYKNYPQHVIHSNGAFML